MRQSTLSRGPHKVSVAVPVRNEAQSIGPLLDSLCAQTRPPDEIVVCDGGSTDNTLATIERYVSHGLPLKLIRIDPAFPGRARNLAIQAARFELIALADAGLRLHPRWLEQLLAPFESFSPPDVVFGSFEPVHRSFRQRCIALAFVPSRDRHSGLRTPSLASMAMRHDIWMRLGGFREDLRSTEDLLFIKAISEHGLSVRFAPDAIVFWDPPKNFVGAFRRFATYSYFNIRAGLAREWQLPLLRIYLLTALLAATALWTPYGYLAPLAVIGARSARRVIREMGSKAFFNIPLVAGVMIALAVIDFATLYGCWRWVLADWIPRVKWRHGKQGGP